MLQPDPTEAWGPQAGPGQSMWGVIRLRLQGFVVKDVSAHAEDGRCA